MPNTEQIRYWDGEGGAHWVAEHDRYAAMTTSFGERVLDAAGLEPGTRVLEIGCGAGALALAAGERVGPDGLVLGVDISGPMLGLARGSAQAAGLDHVRFEQGDAQVYDFEEGGFDVAMSRFGVMFFDDPEAAFANLGRALKPGGRMAFVCWKPLFDNEWVMVPVGAALQHVPMPELGEPGAPGPFALADPERIEAVLGAGGFSSWEIEPVEERLRMGSDVDDVVAFMRDSDIGRTLMGDADPDTVERAMQAVGEALTPHQTDEGVMLTGRAWLVTATR